MRNSNIDFLNRTGFSDKASYLKIQYFLYGPRKKPNNSKKKIYSSIIPGVQSYILMPKKAQSSKTFCRRYSRINRPENFFYDLSWVWKILKNFNFNEYRKTPLFVPTCRL
jgi:transposase